MAGEINGLGVVMGLTITVDYTPYTDYAMIILKNPIGDFPENTEYWVNYMVTEIVSN